MKELNLALEMLQVYLQGIWLRRRYIILTAWVVCPIGWLFVFNLPPVYKAEAKLYVETRSVLDPILSGLAISTDPEQELALMAKTLLSRPNLEKIARATDLDVQAPDSQAYERLIDSLRDDIKFSSSGRENIYVISYANASSPLALKVVQETLNSFVESQVGNAAADNKKAAEFLDAQIKEYEARLAEAEKRLSDFKKEQIGLGVQEGSNFYARIEAEKEKLEEAKLALAQIEKQLDSAKRQLAGETSDAALSTEGKSAFASQYDERIKLLQGQLDALLIRYTDDHPDVKETRRLLESLQQMRRDELEQLRSVAASSPTSSAMMSQNQVYQELRLNVARLENEAESLRVRVKNYQDKLDTLERQRNVMPDIEARFAGLNRDYEVTKGQYEELLSRKEAVQLTQKRDETSSDVQFKTIEPPRVPIKPSGPPRVLLYTAVLAVGFALGVFLAFARSQLQPVVTSALQLKTISDFPVYGLVSHINKDVLIAQGRRHLFYFLLLTAVLVGGYALFIINDLVVGITASSIKERFL